MPRPMASELHVARNILRQERGWLEFIEVSLHGGDSIRLVRSDRHVFADDRTWQAASVSIERSPEDSEGTLGELSFSVSNVSREPLRLVEVEDELLGCEVIVWYQHAARLEAFEPSLSWRHLIVDAEISELTAKFTAGHASDGHRVPGPVYTRQAFPQLLAGVGVRL